jgi:hypothetical protein
MFSQSQNGPHNKKTTEVGVAGPPDDGQQQQQQGRVFADWSVYKSQAAMTAKFIKPTWAPTQSGDGSGFVVDRCGGWGRRLCCLRVCDCLFERGGRREDID